jgi:hypothetical protein
VATVRKKKRYLLAPLSSFGDDRRSRIQKLGSFYELNCIKRGHKKWSTLTLSIYKCDNSAHLTYVLNVTGSESQWHVLQSEDAWSYAPVNSGSFQHLLFYVKSPQGFMSHPSAANTSVILVLNDFPADWTSRIWFPERVRALLLATICSDQLRNLGDP